MFRLIAFVAFFAFSTTLVPAAPTLPAWRKTLSTRLGKHPALRPLTAEYRFGWSGLAAADAKAQFSRRKGELQLALTAKTLGMARGLWRMDSEGLSTVNAATGKPLKLAQTEKYARKTVETTVEFTPKGARRLKVSEPPDKEPAKPRTFKFSEVHDLHSAFLFIRSQRLQTGDTLRLCVYPGSSPYLAEIKVLERAKVKAAGREWDAIPCDIQLRKINKELELAPHTKFKKATAWLSDDADRLLLRIEADIAVGNVWAEMSDVKFAQVDPPKAAPQR